MQIGSQQIRYWVRLDHRAKPVRRGEMLAMTKTPWIVKPHTLKDLPVGVAGQDLAPKQEGWMIVKGSTE